MWFYLGTAAVCTIKHSPLWLLAILPARAIDTLVDPSPAHYHRLLTLLAATLLLLVLNIPSHMFFVRLFSDLTRTLEQRLRLAVARRLQQLSISYRGGLDSGRLQTKMLRDAEQVQLMSMEIGATGVSALLQLSFVIAFTAWSQPFMLLCFTIIAPAAVGLSRMFRSFIQARNHSYRRNFETMNSRAMDMLGMLALTRAHGIEESALGNFDAHVLEVSRHGRRLDRINAVFTACTWVTFQLFALGVLATGMWVVARGWMKPGDLILYTAFFAQLISSINQVLNLYPVFALGSESLRSLGEVLQSPDIEHNEGRAVVTTVRGGIAFDEVSFTYPGSTSAAVRDLSLHIAPGSTLAIVGASGSGKSTFINLAIGFLRPTAGRILLDGTDMEEIDMRSWRQHLALVPQQIILFNGSIRENIVFGLPHVEEEFFNRVVELTHVREFVSRLPEGFDTLIGENGARLSGGQKQRIAIARALIRDPRVIVLDEPTSALDLESERLVQQALDELTRGRTTIIVAHRLSTIRNADHICVFSEGRLIESGSHDELLAHPGAFARLHAAAGSTAFISAAL
ncbi:MAG TPA: ABC transporter ATP-binding protein [Chthoniobacterales bacterium]|nr:ABC transporter ATP-binding protein [Chthoniobacterales bacterium]